MTFFATPEAWTNGDPRSLLVQGLDVDGSGKSVGYRDYPGGASTTDDEPFYVEETQSDDDAQTGMWVGLNQTGYRTRPMIHARVTSGTASAAIYLPDTGQITTPVTFTNTDWQWVELEEYIPLLGICDQFYELRVWGTTAHIAGFCVALRPTIYDITSNIVSGKTSTTTVSDAPSASGASSTNMNGESGVSWGAVLDLPDDGLPSTYMPLLRVTAGTDPGEPAGYGSPSHFADVGIDLSVYQDGSLSGGIITGGGGIVAGTLEDPGEAAFSDGVFQMTANWSPLFGDRRIVKAGSQQLDTGHAYRLAASDTGIYDMAQLYRCMALRACAEFTAEPSESSSGNLTIEFDAQEFYTGGSADVDHFQLVVTDMNGCPVLDQSPVTSPHSFSLHAGSFMVNILAVMADDSFCWEERDITVVGQIIRYR